MAVLMEEVLEEQTYIGAIQKAFQTMRQAAEEARQIYERIFTTRKRASLLQAVDQAVPLIVKGIQVGPIVG